MVIGSQIAIQEIIDIGDKLRGAKVRLRDVVRDFDEEADASAEEARTERVLKHIDKIAESAQCKTMPWSNSLTTRKPPTALSRG